MKAKPVWSVAFLAVVNVSIFLAIPTKLAGPIWVTQNDLTTEGLGAALMHLRKATVLSNVLQSCLKVPAVKSTHGYYVSDFFHGCSSRPSWGPLRCKVKVFLVVSGLRYWMEGRGFVDLDTLRMCHSIEVLNPELRDYENRYNTTAFLIKNLKRRDSTPLDCNGVDTVFHYRYGDIAQNRVQKESKQVHHKTVSKLIQKGIIEESTLLIVTDPSGQKHISSQFPSARFFTRNDPAELQACAGIASTFIAGGSTYAYVCFQMINPRVVFTSNVNANSRVRYPRDITIALPR